MRMTFRIWLGGAAAAASLAMCGAAFAHITVFPKQATFAEAQKYMVRVPNERKVSTLKVEGQFPPELKVESLDEAPGWTIEVRRNAAGAITGATWTGNLPAEGFVAFGLNAVNPTAAPSLTWSFVQYYDGGEVVSWSGPKGSKTPAPVVMLYAPGQAPPPPPPPVRLPKAPE